MNEETNEQSTIFKIEPQWECPECGYWNPVQARVCGWCLLLSPFAESTEDPVEVVRRKVAEGDAEDREAHRPVVTTVVAPESTKEGVEHGHLD